MQRFVIKTIFIPFNLSEEFPAKTGYRLLIPLKKSNITVNSICSLQPVFAGSSFDGLNRIKTVCIKNFRMRRFVRDKNRKTRHMWRFVIKTVFILFNLSEEFPAKTGDKPQIPLTMEIHSYNGICSLKTVLRGNQYDK